MKILSIIHKLIARNKGEVAESAIDYYSLMHIVFGCITFLIAVMFLNLFPPIKEDNIIMFALMGSLYVAIIWEIIENYVIDKTRLKHMQKKDSLINSLTDIIFTHAGSILGFILFDTNLLLFLIITIIIIEKVWRYETEKK